MPVNLDAIRSCLEGVIPAVFATCDHQGVPNVTYVSQVHYVDRQHVALSFQFFNKTRENILENPHATAFVIDPATVARYRLALRYLRTETDGPLFQSMKAKLAGIASQTGMSGVFRLLGSDIYQVLEIEEVPATKLPLPPPGCNQLAALRRVIERLSDANDLALLLDQTLHALQECFGMTHSMILMLDEAEHKLYTVASNGYSASGVGSEIPMGAGVIGVAAEYRTPIRITHMTAEYSYTRAIQDNSEGCPDTAIPYPGLPDPRSQLAVPVIGNGQVLAVLFVESEEDMRFAYDDEDALVAVAGFLGQSLQRMKEASELPDEPDPDYCPVQYGGPPIPIRRYAANDSVFIGEDYLIKGVAGAIFWRLLRGYVEEQRTDFSNRELRLDRSLRLPEIDDNLEARLILLQRRLAERTSFLAIEKTGRGRFRLQVQRPITLLDNPEQRAG